MEVTRSTTAPGDIGRQHFRTVPNQPRPWLRAERNDGLLSDIGHVRDPRQTVGEPPHLQASQIDTDGLRLETPAPENRHLDVRSEEGCREIIGVSEGTHYDRGHGGLS